MKNLAFTLALFLGLANFAFAQEKPNEQKEKMTLEQRNTLRLKKLTLDLNLSSSQQKELAPIIAEQTKKMESKREQMKSRKENKKKPTANEKFEQKNKNLDEQIEMKAKMSKILNADQMQKWESIKEKRKSQMHKMRKANQKKKADNKEVVK